LQRTFLVLLGFVLACGQNGGADRPGSIPGPGASILLISIDSTRRDLLGVYGYRGRYEPELSPSPNLDRLAGEGVVLDDAYAPTSWTLPSHVSLLTGEPILVHGVDLSHQRPDPSRPVLAEILRAAGYRTAGFFSGAYLEPHFGHERGSSATRSVTAIPRVWRICGRSSHRAVDGWSERSRRAGKVRPYPGGTTPTRLR
jgi:hypothetical protein